MATTGNPLNPVQTVPARSNSRIVRLREAGQPRGSADYAGILLHGRSRTKQEMLDLAGPLDIGNVRWLAPYADRGLWYPGRYMEPLESNEPQLTRAVERVHWLMSDASENGRLGPEQIFIVGFSQGACIASEFALRYPAKVAALVIFSGCLMGPPETIWKTADGRSLKGTSIFITGSDVDEWIEESRSRETARVFRELGADVELRIYPGKPHVVSKEELAEAHQFLASRLEA
ncbi:MAG: alpha/beta fold hydrolase [Acidobacteriota bacterium]